MQRKQNVEINSICSIHSNPYLEPISIYKCDILAEIDTGSCVNLMTLSVFRSLQRT